MESQYHQFESTNNSVHGEQKMTMQNGMKRIVVSALYVLLVLLLLILLLVTGIKFSHLNKEITDVKVHLQRISQRILTSPVQPSSSSGRPIVENVYVEKLVPVRGTCTEGWVSFQSSCYLLSTTAVTWNKAEEQCRAHGGHLVVLNNVLELDYISRIVEINYNYWIGLVERENEGHWSWVDGTDINSTPTFWDVGQPDDWDYVENGEDCGQLHASVKRKRKLWNDADCNLPNKYICEKSA